MSFMSLYPTHPMLFPSGNPYYGRPRCPKLAFGNRPCEGVVKSWQGYCGSHASFRPERDDALNGGAVRMRGWTFALVRDFLPQPEYFGCNPETASGPYSPVWMRETVEAAERELPPKAAARLVAARERAEKREAARLQREAEQKERLAEQRRRDMERAWPDMAVS